MSRRQKLELTWIDKETRPKLEPRILLEGAGNSYHAKHRVTDNDLFENRLIFGDNLLALKALEAGVHRQDQVHLHRPTVQHRFGLHSLR